MPIIDIGRIKAGFRVSIKGGSQKAFGITREQIERGELPKIGFVDYDPKTRTLALAIGRTGVDGPTVTNSAGRIEYGNDMRVTFPPKGSFRFTDELVSMAPYEATWFGDNVWLVVLPEGMVLEQSDNLFELEGL